MKKQMLFSVLGILAMGLTSCGGVPKVEAMGANAGSAGVAGEVRYVRDGQTLSSEALKGLKKQFGTLYYLLEPESLGEVAQVYTSRSELEQVMNKVQSQGLCFTAPGRSGTRVFDGFNYGGDEQYFAKGTLIGDLTSSLQGNGDSWLNDITSVKFADCATTFLYENQNFNRDDDGIVLVGRGSNIADLSRYGQQNHNNIFSSIEITN